MRQQEPATAAAAGTTAKLQAAEGAAAGSKEGFFWMREPRTGNWMPENHFNDVDAADLRSQLLFAKKN